mmetsp:Transcript_2818/g.3022  ORF Transcript_2818/g.3022 Transcript_2818/m.3022 type:complete len:734 (+) Transcript_2818:50-2251(+)
MLLKVICAFIVVIGLLPAWAFKVGVGSYDMTGPCTEINFMGYALPSQRGSGIHLRLRARAFAFEDETTGKRAVFVSVDGGMGSDLVKMRVLDKLNAELGEGIYTHDNVAISGTHTHSGPGGFQQYVLYQVTSLGFVKETFDAWVNGISQAIIHAHNRIQPAKTLVNTGLLYDSNINRSPTSYELNPQNERDQYPEGNTDKTMTLLSFVTDTPIPQNIGVLNWFAVHGTSLNNTNTLTSGDNKGYASYLLEREINGPEVATGAGQFVAAFASTNLGDVSPNTAGPKCIDTGLPCDMYTSTCGGKPTNCIAFGPGTNGDMFESTQIIGDKQYQFAKQLMTTATEQVTGPIDYRHSWVQFPFLNVTTSSGKQVTLCSAAVGYAFAAGTTDGPGFFAFSQGATTGNPFWDRVRDFLSKPTDEEISCQAPKPILFNTADIDVPHEWDPSILPIQIIRLGNVFILSAPSEFTTMAGRRLRNAVRKIFEDSKIAGDQKIYVTIAGLTNTYSAYVTTFEEYQAQRFEAAATYYGPYTLDGYIQEFSRLARDMVNGVTSTTGEGPEDYTDRVIQLMPEPKFDRVAKGVKFGDVVEGLDVKETYKIGETAQATFHAANPRNNQRIQGTYIEVDYKISGEDAKKTTWKTVANDGDWSTKFQWRAGPEDPLDLGVSKQSIATISWTIPSDAKEGTYRLCYQGDHKTAKNANVIPFRGCSAEFTVTASGEHKHHHKHDKNLRKERE